MPALALLVPLLLSLLCPGPPPYSATVVDATTNQPLPGVSVRGQGPGAAATLTDERGRFTLPARPRVLDLAHLGYAPLHLPLPPGDEAAPGAADTLRLLPQAYALAEVTVRPPRSYVLTSVAARGAKLGRVLYPGQAVALLLARPAEAPADQPCVVSAVRLFLSTRPRQGRLRVRLVEVLPGPPDRPGPRDLLPTPALCSLAQARHGELTLDLSAAGLLLPATGLAVVIECLPTDPADQGATVRLATDGRGRTTVTLSGPADQPARTYPSADFPVLTARRGAGPGTWNHFPGRPGWSTRSAGAYTVRAELTVLGY